MQERQKSNRHYNNIYNKMCPIFDIYLYLEKIEELSPPSSVRKFKQKLNDKEKDTPIIYGMSTILIETTLLELF